MNGIQNEMLRVRHNEQTEQKLREARLRQAALESGGLHKWVSLPYGSSNLRLLCKIDESGNLLPKEIERINKVKKSLGIE